MFASKSTRAGVAPLPVTLVVLLACGAANAGVTLRWKFEPGQTRRYEMTQRTESTASVQGQDIQVIQDLTTEITWRTREVAADGTATLEQTIDRVKMVMELPNGRLEYDSERPDAAILPEPPEAMTPLIEIFQAMIGQPITSVMTPRGQIRELKLAEGFREAMKKAAGPASAALGDLMSEEGLKKLAGLGGLEFPEGSIEPGATWTTGGRSKLGPLGAVKLEAKHSYAGTDTTDAGPVERIDLQVFLSSEPATGSGDQPALTIDEVDMRGVMRFDNRAGTLVSSTIDQSMKMKVQIESETIDQTVSTHTEMRQLPPGSGPAR